MLSSTGLCRRASPARYTHKVHAVWAAACWGTARRLEGMKQGYSHPAACSSSPAQGNTAARLTDASMPWWMYSGGERRSQTALTTRALFWEPVAMRLKHFTRVSPRGAMPVVLSMLAPRH
jgi:hypothetical protein